MQATNRPPEGGNGSATMLTGPAVTIEPSPFGRQDGVVA
jgi:hypothetical protein